MRFGLLAMSSTQDVRYSAEKIAAGPGARQQALQRRALRCCGIDERTRRRRPRAAHRRGPLDPLAAAAQIEAQTLGADRELRLLHAALGLYDFVYGELCDWYLELVKPRLVTSGDAADAGGHAAATCCARRCVAHPVIPFVTEELWSYLPGGEGLLAGRRFAEPEDALSRPGGRGGLRARDRGGQALRGWRDAVGAPRRATVPARLDAEGYDATGRLRRAPGARLELSRPTTASRWPSVPVPGGTRRGAPGEGLDLGAAERRRDGRAGEARGRDRARRGQAREPGVRRARRPPRSWRASASKLEHLRAELEAL